MLIVVLKTDSADTTIGLYEDRTALDVVTWPAGRQLAETIHRKLDELLKNNAKTLYDVQAFACFKGPGSFTGLRIGLAVSNTLAYSLEAPIIAAEGDNWLADAIDQLLSGKNEEIAVPEYGAPVHITAQKK